LCLIVLAWRARADLALVVAANRDEWRDRPAEPAHWWPDIPSLLAGRDVRAGGTWMGVTREGRFAAVTNFRDPTERRSGARSRGELVSAFLSGRAQPEAFLTQVLERAPEYNAFNLLAGDREGLWYLASREARVRPVPPGVHGLSNHVLDEPWPKVVRARRAMEASLGEPDPVPRLFEVLSDAGEAPDNELPETGVGVDWERRLSAALITGKDYGTRASTVLSISAAGEVSFEERSRGPNGAEEARSRHDFRLLAPAPART